MCRVPFKKTNCLHVIFLHFLCCFLRSLSACPKVIEDSDSAKGLKLEIGSDGGTDDGNPRNFRCCFVMFCGLLSNYGHTSQKMCFGMFGKFNHLRHLARWNLARLKNRIHNLNELLSCKKSVEFLASVFMFSVAGAWWNPSNINCLIFANFAILAKARVVGSTWSITHLEN